jgi:hypothetical protein
MAMIAPALLFASPHPSAKHLVVVQPPLVVRGATTVTGCPATRPPPRPPGRPAAAVPAGGTMLPQSAAAPQIGCPPHCPSQSCPCATARPGAGPAPPHCWSVPPRPPAQTSTARATTWCRQIRARRGAGVSGNGFSQCRQISGTTTTTSSTCSAGSSARKAPRWPGWPPRFRPEGGGRRFAGA